MRSNPSPTYTDENLFRPDEPVESVNEDRFDHKYFVDVLKYIIRNCDAPLNIALYGKWGIGKSSILNFFRQSIRQDRDLNAKFKFVVIDVWKLSPNILKQEFLEVLNQKLDKPIGQETIEENLWRYQEKESLISPKMSWRSKHLRMGIAVVLAVLGTLGLGHYIDLHYGNPAVLTSSFVVSLIPIVLAITNTLREVSKNVAKSGRTIIPRIESYTQFQGLFEEMIDKNKNRKKLIIAIDNLDRCDDESVVSILNMIKTFLSSPKCVFIVSCDQDAIIKHLQQKREFGDKRDAKEFLAKFFQVSLHIPNQIKGRLHSYAKSQLEIFKPDINPDPNVADVFANAITKNPRKIRQFVYNFAIAYKMAAIKENREIIAKDTVTGNTPFLAKVTVLREEWPDFFSKLEKNPTLLDTVQKFIDIGADSEDGKKHLEEILQGNEGLKHFLKSTSTTKSVQVLPFIQLGQESFESALSELESMIVKVNLNDVESVKEILRRDPGKQHEYVLELCRLTERYMEDDRIMVANNSINVLVNIYDTVEDHSRKEIIKLINTFMRGTDVLSNLMMFDIDILFPITLSLDSDVKEKIHGRYAKNLSMPNYTIKIIKKFIDNPMLISYSVCQISDENLQLLVQSNKELFYDAVELLADNDTVARKFIREHTLRAMINHISQGTRDRWMGMYLKLRHLANEKNQRAFAEKMLSTIKTNNGQNMPPEHRKIYETFQDLTSSDFMGSAAKYTYDSLKKPAEHYADVAEKAMIAEIILKTYATLDHSDMEEFATGIFAPIIIQIAPQQLSRIAGVIRDESVQILEFAPVADAVFSLLQSNPSPESIALMYAGTPENKWEDFEDRIIQMHNADLTKVQTLSSAFDLSNRAPKKLRAKIFGQILQSCRQFGHGDKLSIYQDLMARLDGLDRPSIGTLADELLSELKPDDGVQIDTCIGLISRCFDETTNTKQSEIIFRILTKLKESPPSKTDFVTYTMRFLISKNTDMFPEEKEHFANFAIDTLENANNVPTVIEILNQFNHIEFGDKKYHAYELAGKLCKSLDNGIRSRAQEIFKD